MIAPLSRRALIATAGGLIVSFALPETGRAQTNAGNPPEVGIDGMLRISPDGRCVVLTSKTEFGQGILAALAQVVAEELDLPFDRVSVPHPDTNLMPDHGLTGGSLTMQIVAPRLRRAAATARAHLAKLGAEKLQLPISDVETVDGFVRARADHQRRLSYGDLIGAKNFNMMADPAIPVKKPEDWKIVGKNAPRPDVLDKVSLRREYIHAVRLPGMLHARVVHPPRVGAKLVSVHEQTIADTGARLVRKGDLVAVVAEREWHAVRALDKLRVDWSEGRAIPAMKDVFDAARNTPVMKTDVTANRGDPGAALGSAAKRLSASYAFAVQTHGTIGPSCAVAHYVDGRLTVYSGTQSPFDLRLQLSEMLGFPQDRIQVIYRHSAGCFGRNGLEDAASEAAVLAVELSPHPVRVQWMRQDEHRSEPKGPPVVMDVAGGVTENGRIAAWDGTSFVPNHLRNVVRTTAATALGRDDGSLLSAGNVQSNSNPPYDGIPSARTRVNRIAETPFRPSWIRTPGRMQNNFAVESFMDELAAAARRDPVRFRLDHLSEPRGRATIEAAAKAANWVERASPKSGETGDLRRGRGLAYIHYDNARTHVACVMSVEVNMRTGEIRALECKIAQDCGQVINPDGVRLQAEGCVIQTLSRTLHEEITWEGNAITSLDWGSYPLLTFPEVPSIEVVIMNRPNDPPWGAGEPAAAVIPAAVANAVFDATGIRLRTAPFTPARVLASFR